MSGLYGIAVDPTKVAIYIRWSTEEQTDGTTLEVQREACEHYVLAQGWKIREDLIFVDDGYSGGSLDRPGLTALREAVTDGLVTCVVVFKLDRLSRSVLDTVSLVLKEWEGLCYIKSTREPVDTTTPAGKMFFYMLASYAEWERSVIKERTMSGKIKRAQQGKNPGGSCPYGYTRGDKPGEVVIHEAEATIVRRVFEQYLAGKGIHRIALGLNQSGMKPRRSDRWFSTTIAQMLSNPMYMGVMEYGRSTIVPENLRKSYGKQRMTFDEPRYARVEGAVPAIIPQEMWEMAQKVHASKAGVRGKRALAPDFLLTGIAKCTCGGAMRGDTRAAKGIRYYRCLNNTSSLPNPCKSAMIQADVLEEAVVEQIRQVFDPSNLEQFMANWNRELKARAKKVEESLAGVREALGALGRKRGRLDADYDSGELPAKLYTARVEKLAEEQVQLEALERETLGQLEEIRQAPFDMKEYNQYAKKVDAWDHLTVEERKQLLRFALESCVVFRPQIKGQPRERPQLEVSLTIMRPWCKAG